MRRQHRSFRAHGKKRRLEWGRGSIAANAPGNITSGTTLLSAFWYKVPAGVVNNSTPGLDLEPEDWTLVRTMPSIQACVSAGAGISVPILAAGLIVWEGIDDTVPSVLLVPEPVLDGDADWIWHWSRVGCQQVSSTTQFLADNADNSLDKQSRAQRKLSSRQGILLVVECSNINGVNNLSDFAFNFYGRSLYKLP